MNSPYRSHRFPPLAERGLAEALSLQGSAEALQAALADGHARGLARGHEEGFDKGLAEGRAVGEAQGRERGEALGRAEGEAQLLARWQRVAAPMQAATEALRQVQADYQAALRREMVELVERVARQVIRAELTLNPTQILKLVEETLQSMPPAVSTVEVFLNSEDLRAIQAIEGADTRGWNLIADPALEAGECRVQVAGFEADAGCRQRLQACMGQVASQLLGAEEPAPAEVPLSGAAA
ncbi:MAG: flagellar assembly protein H [Comamonadaceae bacterium]|jgi:flagellar assembly protein FliH|uniref:Flagellar assembly protein FliH n=1 Tax=Hydrogenophaga borbori TaxID=2294117 RepID=A0A372EHT4_9BURK|nr:MULTISPECIES: flagellar assembly protein FliH [Hydrogenophaga]NCT97784.1 flagellar assembly protein H [Comamonadaceae bacterium]RFP78004.1 flagellar assembly protein H [Hydrogenophaga borbori]WQB83010.1 flagellar assembly protein FliH [Hydrogenophaga sp. SNF1]